MSDTKREQIELVERMQLKWLQHMEKLLDNGNISSTDLATLARLLMQNGWTLDPARLPKGLKDKLTTHLDPTAFDDGDPDVVGKIA